MRTLAARLQIRSDGADVAGTARYLMASFPRYLYRSADVFHPRQRTVVDLGIVVLHSHLEVIAKEKLIEFILA